VIYGSKFQSNTAGYSVSRSEAVLRNFLNLLRSNSWRATCDLQGGAIYVQNSNEGGCCAVLEIYDSAFIGNTANAVSRFCSCYLAVL
jgi:hypothetical protein